MQVLSWGALGPQALFGDELLRVDPARVEFGEVDRGLVRETRVRVVNISEGVIEIRHVAPECDCIRVAINGPTRLEPGGLVELQLAYETKNLPRGQSDKIVRIEYDAGGEAAGATTKDTDAPATASEGKPSSAEAGTGSEQVYELHVGIEIAPGVEVEPPAVGLGRVHIAETATQRIRIFNADNIEFSVREVLSSQPEMLRARPAAAGAGRAAAHEWIVELGPNLRPGRFSGMLTVYTDHPTDHEVELPVYAEAYGPVAVEPTTLYSSGVKAGTTVEYTLRVTSGDAAGLALVTVSPGLAALRPELLRAAEKPDELTMRFNVPGGGSERFYSGTLQLGAGEGGAQVELNAFVYLGEAAAAPAAGGAGPRLHIDTAKLDLGRVEEGQVPEFVFRVENRGDAPLEILDDRSTCTCLAYELPQRALAPGETMYVPARYVTTGHRGRESGAVTLTTNDATQARAQLLVTLDIRAFYEMEPLGSLTLQPQKAGLPGEPTLKLLPLTAEHPLVVQELTAERGLVRVEKRMYEREGRRGEEIVISAAPNATGKTVQDALIIGFAVGPDAKRVRVPVKLPLLGDVTYEPKILARPIASPRGHFLGKIEIKSTGGEPLELIHVRSSGPIEVQTRASVAEHEYEIGVRIAEDAPTGPFGATVSVLTDDGGQPMIEVPVFANAQPYVYVIPAEVLVTPQRPARVRLLWNERYPIRIGEFKADDSRVTARVEPGPPDRTTSQTMSTAQLDIALAADAAAGEFQTVLRAQTGWATFAEVTVPVFVRAR